MGGDAIGMSTVPEAIVARRSGMKVLGLSCITNRATGVSPEKLSHEAVLSVSQQIASDLFPLIKEIVSRIGQQA
jgi:purine-nucleoside phosphorylase